MANWYVLKIGGRVPTYKHPTFESAMTEAKRLMDYTGGEFEILRIDGALKPPARYVAEDYRDNPPF